MDKRITPFCIFLVVAASLVVAGCSTPVAAPFIFTAGNQTDLQSKTGQNIKESYPTEMLVPLPGRMVSFYGYVFVAVSELNREAWDGTGWSISDHSIDTDSQEVPEDCTLYGHKGVDGQWVGRCRGNVIIPKDGAKHIAVMLTDQGGGTTLIQVAPPP